MNRWEVEVILHNKLGWWGYDFPDDPAEEDAWNEMVDDFCDKYRNKEDAYADGVPKPSKEFWDSHVIRKENG